MIKTSHLLVPASYRPDIDGLRAFAVISVVLYHAFPKVIRGGYVGVDIFFVISGFLISSILFKDISKGRFSLTAFYGRRIRRIFPALAACLAAVLAYGFVALMPLELAQLGKHVFFGAGFLSNIALWNETGYFDSAAGVKPLLHLWSLGVEEQFYIIWPALLWAAFKIDAPVGRVLASLFVTSFVLNIALSISDISADFYLPFSRFWELLTGAALAWRRDIAPSPNVRSWLSLAGLAALVISVAVFTADMSFPGWPALVPVAGATAIILAGPDTPTNRIVFSNRAAVFIGLISYPLYLWHWPLISYANIIRSEKPLTPLLAIALVALSILLAWLTYRFIEYPIRFGAHRHRRTQIVAACVAALGACGLIVWINQGFPQRFPPYPGDLDIRRITAAKLDTIYAQTKGMTVIDRDTVLVSQIGDGDRKVVFAGDSLVMHYGPRVQQLADDGTLAANTYFVTRQSCPPVSDFLYSYFSQCPTVSRLISELVKRERIQSVVLGASWTTYIVENVFVERQFKRLPLNTQEGRDAFYANLEDDVRALQGDGAKVYLVLGSPSDTRLDPSKMVTRGLTGFHVASVVSKPLSVAELQTIHAAVNSKLRSVANNTGATLLDPFPDICGPGDSCSPLFGNSEPKFVDSMHLRPIFVREHLHFFDFLLK